MATTTAPVVTSRSQGAFFFFAVFFAVTVSSIYDKDARVFDPTSPIAQHFAPAKWFVLVHGFFAAIAMAVAAFQFPMVSEHVISASIAHSDIHT